MRSRDELFLVPQGNGGANCEHHEEQGNFQDSAREVIELRKYLPGEEGAAALPQIHQIYS